MAKHRVWAGVLCFFLSLMLVLPVQAEPGALSVGQAVGGFTVVSIEPMPLVGGELIHLTHDRTGAEALFIKNRDTNRAFEIAFRTPAESDMGVPHVFEHTSLFGSRKYPSSSLFFELSNQTYQTFMNAMTGSNYTMYPCSSLSEDQLFKLFDFYLSGVFDPLIYDDERIIQREAWRYALPDADSPIGRTGTVLNEMKGNQIIDWQAYMDLRRTLFPGSTAGNNSGGDPLEIPNMVNQDLIDFHQAYYHPSNALFILYGDLDPARFLTFLDEAFLSRYDRQDIEIADPEYVPLTEPVTASYAFPVEMGSGNGTSIIYYGFVVDARDAGEHAALMTLSSILSNEGSPVIARMREALPAARVSVSYTVDTPAPYMAFCVEGLTALDAETARQVIDAALEEVAADGVDPMILDAEIASNKIAMLIIPESGYVGLSMAQNLGDFWASLGQPDAYAALVNEIMALDEASAASLPQTFVREKLLNNPRTALTVTFPEPGLAEARAQAETEALAAIKDQMSEAEIAAMVEASAAFDAWVADDGAPDQIAELQAVTVGTLPEELPPSDVRDVPGDGVRIVSSLTDTADISSVRLMLSADALPMEMLHDCKLFASLLTQLDTAQYTQAQLAARVGRYLYGGSFSPGLITYPDGGYASYLMASWMALHEDMPEAVALAREILFETDLTDAVKVGEVVSRSLTALKQAYNTEPYQMQMNRALGVDGGVMAMRSYMGGLDYLWYLQDVESQLKTDPDAVIARLEAVRDALKNRDGAVAVYAGNSAGLAVFKPLAEAAFSELPNEPREVASRIFDKPAPREAFVADLAVQFNLLAAPLKDLNAEYDAAMGAVNRLVYDRFLIPELRFANGAYDCISALEEIGAFIISYRDPELGKTYDEVYASLADELRALDITQEVLDGYIISAYSDYALSQGPLTEASTAALNYLAGRPKDERLTWMRQLKALTVDRLKGYASLYETLYEKGLRSTAGGAAVIERNADRFDAVLRMQNNE